jgi:hypothetical protein
VHVRGEAVGVAVPPDPLEWSPKTDGVLVRPQGGSREEMKRRFIGIDARVPLIRES